MSSTNRNPLDLSMGRFKHDSKKRRRAVGKKVIKEQVIEN